MPERTPYDPSRTALFHPERQETLFAPGSSYSAPQLAVEAARLAYYRVEESKAQQARLAEALARASFTGLTLFSDPTRGAAAFAAVGSDGTSLLSFRGTQPDNFKALLTDLRVKPVAWIESTGEVHEGFALAMRALKPQVADWMARTKPDISKLILTGHSLGAALATLAATIWRSEWLITFGSPRVGDTAFVGTVLAKHHARFVDCCDAVTEEPRELLGYRHAGKPNYVTRDALIIENPESSFIDKDRQTARIDYARNYAWKVKENAPFRDWADHALKNYARAVF
jgi:hypothetical protein